MYQKSSQIFFFQGFFFFSRSEKISFPQRDDERENTKCFSVDSWVYLFFCRKRKCWQKTGNACTWLGWRTRSRFQPRWPISNLPPCHTLRQSNRAPQLRAGCQKSDGWCTACVARWWLMRWCKDDCMHVATASAAPIHYRHRHRHRRHHITGLPEK